MASGRADRPARPQSLSHALLLWLGSLSLPSDDGGAALVSANAGGLDSMKSVCDGELLWQVCGTIDASFFRNPRGSTAAASDNWVLRFNSLKRLYKLVVSYFEDELSKSTLKLTPTPDLQKIAKDQDEAEATSLTLLILAAAVEASPDAHVTRITKLETWAQARIMRGLESVQSRLTSKAAENGADDKQTAADDDFYNLQTDRSRMRSEKESLDTMYSSLLTAFQKLQAEHDEAQRRIESLDEHLSEARREAVAAAEGRRGSAGSGEPEAVVKEEMQRLRGDLGRTEEELAEAEGTVEKQTKIIEELNRRVDELGGKAEEAARLKDRVDELRHEADRLRKAESVAEKYRKKLDDAADLRRQNKALEEQNSELLDKHSALEDEYHKVAAFKPLMEQYKTRVADLEALSSRHQRDGEAARLELERTREKLAAAADERDRAAGEVALLDERVKELETGPKQRARAGPGQRTSEDEDEEGEMSGGLDDAMAGRTMTSIKLQLRQAQRALAEAKRDSADSSRVVVLENLLEDAQRMRKRYEEDYLKAQREKLLAEGKLEEIMNGKGRDPDGPEAAIALRQRLNETVEELDRLRGEHLALSVQSESAGKELIVAKSDLALVNKDQLEVVRNLRESVSAEKTGLERELDRMRGEAKKMADQAAMQASQINSLLVDKVDLQADGIGQRERRIEHEKEVGALKASLSAKGLSAEDRERLGSMQARVKELEEGEAGLQKKLESARRFIERQDAQFRAEYGQAAGMSDEDRQAYEEEIQTLKAINADQKTKSETAEAQYLMQLRLMSSAWHHLGQQRMREAVAAGLGAGGQRPAPAGWLGQQRQRSMGKGLLPQR